MLKREFHNSVNEIFSKSSCEEEMKIKCDLNGFDYDFCCVYYDTCVKIGEKIKSRTLFPSCYSFNCNTGKMEITMFGIDAYDTPYKNEDTVEIEYFFIDEVLIEEIYRFMYFSPFSSEKEVLKELKKSIESCDRMIKEMEEKHGKGK